MNKNQFNRVMKLVRRTGDRCVVLDNEHDDAVVVMNLDEYEMLVGEDKCQCYSCEQEEDFQDWQMGDEVDNFDDDFAAEKEDQLKDSQFGEHPVVAEENLSVEPITEETIADFPAETTVDFPNIGPEEKINDLPVEETDRFYLEPIDE